jgi:hypothetical protein
MPDSPGRELQVDVTCACNARFLATLDPHFISIETPSDRGKISARGSGRFCTARELMQDLTRRQLLRGDRDCGRIQTRQRHLQRRRQPGRCHGQPVRQYAARWLRNGRRRRRGVALPSAPLPFPLSAACPLPACSWRSQRPRRETVARLVAGLLGRQRRCGWVGGCCQRVWLPGCLLPGRLLAAGLAAGCWLRPSRCLAVITTLATWYRNSVLLSATWLPFRPVFHCLAACRGRNAWGSAAARRGSCFAPSSEQTGSRTRGRSSSHTYCSCHPQPVVYPHPSQPLFSHIEAV